MLAMAKAARPPKPATLGLLILAWWLLVPQAHAAHARKPEPQTPAPTPAYSIPVQPLGFAPPNIFYMEARISPLTVDFIDSDHLLFTFHKTGTLLHRDPNAAPGEEGQMVEAIVLDIASGKVVRRAEWQLRDHSRYLWPIEDGKFLVRLGDDLMETDSSLELKPYLSFQNRLVVVDVSPDRHYLTVETQSPADPGATSPVIDLTGAPLQRPRRINIGIYLTATRHLFLSSETRTPISLPVMQDGFLETVQPPKVSSDWILRKVAFGDRFAVTPSIHPEDLVTLHGGCAPSMLPLSATVLIVGCQDDDSDHLMTAYDLAGHKLWEQWWQSRYVWHTVNYDLTGTRFAMGSLMLNQAATPEASVDPSEVMRQIIGVFDTRSGKLELVRDADPIVSGGQNYALSPDGARFAVLRNGALEIYDLSTPATPPAPTPDNKVASTLK